MGLLETRGHDAVQLIQLLSLSSVPGMVLSSVITVSKTNNFLLFDPLSYGMGVDIKQRILSKLEKSDSTKG